MIDLRSDTVTRPTPAMRDAMARAEVGDDGYGDDPTVNALERKAAAMLGKAAALLVPTGTMGNLCAVFAQTGRGDEVLVESQAHIYRTEQGGLAALAGVPYRVLPGERGMVPIDLLRAELDGSLYSTRLRPALVCVETTHNAAGGTVPPLPWLAAVADVAARGGAAVHMDGARVFNAAAALGVDVSEVARHAGTVTFCLSKGLGAPVGSVLCGPAAVIGRARQARKMLGGTLRQAGVLAAAGIVALDTMVGPARRRPPPGPAAGRGPPCAASRHVRSRRRRHQHRVRGPGGVRHPRHRMVPPARGAGRPVPPLRRDAGPAADARRRGGRRHRTGPRRLPGGMAWRRCAGGGVSEPMPALLRRMAACLAVAVLAGVSGSPGRAAGSSTVEAIRARGSVVCAMLADNVPFSQIDRTGELRGMDADSCRALAAAVLGDPTKITIRPVTGLTRFPTIQGGEADVLFGSTTWTTTRETALGLVFAGANYYSGQGFVVRASLGVHSTRELDGATICVPPGSSSELILQDYFDKIGASFKPVVIDDPNQIIASFLAGRCDAYTRDLTGLAGFRIQQPNLADLVLLPDVISMEPLGAFVRKGDDAWLDIVRWTQFALVAAEQLGGDSGRGRAAGHDPGPRHPAAAGHRGRHRPGHGPGRAMGRPGDRRGRQLRRDVATQRGPARPAPGAEPLVERGRPDVLASPAVIRLAR